jgi:hypothetical protein
LFSNLLLFKYDSNKRVFYFCHFKEILSMSSIKRFISLSVGAPLALSLYSCGKEDAKAILSNLISDSDSQASVAESAAVEGVSNALSGESSSQAGVSLTQSDLVGISPDVSIDLQANLAESSLFSDRNRTCEVGADGSVTVRIENTLPEKSNSFSKGGKQGSSVTSGSSTLTRVWAQTGVTLACNALLKKVAQINWQAASLPKLSITIAKQRTTSQTFDKKGSTVVRKKDETVEGSRNIVWTSAVLSSAELVLSKEITSNVTRSIKITKTDGTPVETSGVFKTKDGDSLKVEIVRNSSGTRALKSKTIKSGTIIATLSPKKGEASTGTSETTFTNFKMEYDTAGECAAKSGSFVVQTKDTAGADVESISCEADASSATQSISCKNKAGEEVFVEAPKCSTLEESQN